MNKEGKQYNPAFLYHDQNFWNSSYLFERIAEVSQKEKIQLRQTLKEETEF